jgi:DNA-binding XRE family transcriptional regulator
MPRPAVGAFSLNEGLRTRSEPVASEIDLWYSIGYVSCVAIIYAMKKIIETTEALRALGRRLRDARLVRNDTMMTFAERLGVSEQTVRAMERGLPTVQIGTWLNALWVLDELKPLGRILEPRESLLERARSERSGRRQRASKRSP